MKKYFNLILILGLTYSVVGQKPPRLIVRGDDLGAAHAINTAIMDVAKNGIQTSIEVMVPTPWFPEAVQLLKNNTHLDVGVHLTITSEWDNVKYRPVTPAKSITNDDGYFYPFIFPNKDYPGQSIMENGYDLQEIEEEFRSQIEIAKRHILNLSHLTCHMGCTRFDPKVKEIADRLAQEYGLHINLEDYQVKNISYIGNKYTPKEKIKALKAMIASLQPGETYLFVDHPGTYDQEMKGMYHKGYEEVAFDRAGVTKAWKDPSVKKLITKRGIE
ncbi:MAG TPA: ChbG/HpnK family deacetylase, partial [Saprospiraceae bacterium]|nr:ChbG/HpnK family deacetylase [Saprospiraceae bacterium]